MKSKNSRLGMISLLLLLMGVVLPTSARDVLTLSQIDTSRLLLGQVVDVYLSVTDPQGLPVEDLKAALG